MRLFKISILLVNVWAYLFSFTGCKNLQNIPTESITKWRIERIYPDTFETDGMGFQKRIIPQIVFDSTIPILDFQTTKDSSIIGSWEYIGSNYEEKYFNYLTGKINFYSKNDTLYYEVYELHRRKKYEFVLDTNEILKKDGFGLKEYYKGKPIIQIYGKKYGRKICYYAISALDSSLMKFTQGSNIPDGDRMSNFYPKQKDAKEIIVEEKIKIDELKQADTNTLGWYGNYHYEYNSNYLYVENRVFTQNGRMYIAELSSGEITVLEVDTTFHNDEIRITPKDLVWKNVIGVYYILSTDLSKLEMHGRGSDYFYIKIDNPYIEWYNDIFFTAPTEEMKKKYPWL